MIREQYDKTNNFFNNEMKKYENKCNESNISIHYCYNYLMYKFQQYKNYKNKINLITRLDFKDKNKIKVYKKNTINSLNEVECFLNNFKKFSRYVRLYKIFK